ncbi:unnamed protein product [Parascedosporium putredinis]|uniref:Uncharacterized protein n=1 Tax=Parascedosporium putredinis TaxID=1442378 RepID=A0A9P1M8D9_9PEZI|nr:unnamed protein product [Parascedosporium putredinis]CAI7992466.1 unnamed protein product [Parascedosporium putredinis]
MSNPAKPAVEAGSSSFAEKMALLKAEDLTDLEKQLLPIFEAALLSKDPPTSDDGMTPGAAAAEIDQLCPSPEALEDLETFVRVFVKHGLAAKDPDYEAANPDMRAEWISLNAFCARLVNTGVVRWTVLAVIEIRAALECDIPDDDTRELRLVVASQWITLCGKELFKDASQANTLNETELDATSPGPLYTGRPGFAYTWGLSEAQNFTS